MTENDPYTFSNILNEAGSIWALLRKRLKNAEWSEIGWCIATLLLLSALILSVVWYSVNK